MATCAASGVAVALTDICFPLLHTPQLLQSKENLKTVASVAAVAGGKANKHAKRRSFTSSMGFDAQLCRVVPTYPTRSTGTGRLSFAAQLSAAHRGAGF